MTFSGTQRKATSADVHAACERLRNWGRWGPDDELGTLNFVGEAEITAAAALARTGKVVSMALPFDGNGPLFGRRGRFNPIHYMILSGTDAYAGVQDSHGIRYADDAVIMPLQCGTQWDALSHVFYRDQMWNGYDIRLVDGFGAKKNGIEKTRDRMVGRGVFLDVPLVHGLDHLPDGYAISADELDYVAAQHRVQIRKGDFVIVRTGQLGARVRSGTWEFFAGGDAPGLALDTADWLYDKQVAAVCSDTFGVEARPNPTDEMRQPWHWIVIPNMGLLVGEIFDLEALSAACAADGTYEFLFVAPALPITGGVGSPVNPLAIK